MNATDEVASRQQHWRQRAPLGGDDPPQLLARVARCAGPGIDQPVPSPGRRRRSIGFGILLRPLLSGIRFGGTDLGFWFAQQGSILVFIALIFYYTWYMNRLDREFDVHEQ